ncbi:MAG: hypothetical protein JRH15_11715 [Deltaproteobacteria bacterium]|nr:hypothetical protein [Deltaproteobacteria bacterium]
MEGGDSDQAHAYTPGLVVSRRTTLRRRRVLPIPGDVYCSTGETVEARKVVAETKMPGDVISVNLANLLSLPPKDVPECVLVKKGDAVEINDVIARTKGIFGLFKSEYKSKATGTVETISEVTGQVILRGPAHPVSVLAFLPGKIVEAIKGQGVVIESECTFIQGIFGIGPETFGKIKMACASPDEHLTADHITAEMKGCVIIGGARMSVEAIRKAVEVGAAGIVSGGIDDTDVKDFLGYDLGVAITGSEQVGLTLIITEGFGDISMAARTFNLLKSREGAEASITGATQIRAGVMRPTIIVPVDETAPPATKDQTHLAGMLDMGCPIRIIRDPYFGQIATVHALPASPQVLDSGSKARVLEAKFDTGEIVTVPRANVELIEGE